MTLSVNSLQKNNMVFQVNFKEPLFPYPLILRKVPPVNPRKNLLISYK